MSAMTLCTAPRTASSASALVNLPSSSRSVVRSSGLHASVSYFPRQACVGGARWRSRPELCTGRTSAVRAVQKADATAERVRAKRELLELLEKTDGAITAEGMESIGALQKLNPNPDASRVPELVNGCFQAVRGTVKGRASAGAGVFASIFTLARAAFGVFKPLKQELIIEEGYNHVGVGREDEYVLAFDVSLKNQEGEAPEFLRGYLLNIGKCSFAPGSEKMTITFLSSLLRPADGVEEAELLSWKRLFQEENPCMDERGWMSAKLAELDGDLVHLYIDDDLRIVQGTFKNIFVMRRLPGPVIPT